MVNGLLILKMKSDTPFRPPLKREFSTLTFEGRNLEQCVTFFVIAGFPLYLQTAVQIRI